MEWNRMGWDMTEKYVPWTSLVIRHRKTFERLYIKCGALGHT